MSEPGAAENSPKENVPASGVRIGVRAGKSVDAAWEIHAGPGGTYLPEQVTNAVLMDIRADVGSIRSMLIYFVVLSIVGMVVGVLYAISQAH